MRLYCFPYSGASASIYYPWLDILPNCIEICPVQLPGRGNRISEAPFTSLPALLNALETGLDPTFSDKPFAFFGHSMGALIGFELARRLEARYRTSPVYLFVSGHSAPQLPDESEPMYVLENGEFIEKLRSLNGTSEEILQDPELLELVLPILRADFELSETYNFIEGSPLECPICACGGLQDKFLDRDGLEAWKVHTTQKFSVRMFQGDHFYLNHNRIYLLQVIAQELIPFCQSDDLK